MPLITYALVTLWTFGLGLYTGHKTQHHVIVMQVHYRCEEDSLVKGGHIANR